MKILLIHPTMTLLLPENYGRPAMYEPLGLAYLAAVARENGHEPIILDCVVEDWRRLQRDGRYTRIGMTDDAIAARIREIGPDLIGITCQFTGFDRDAKRVAALAKQVLPDIPVIAGGADASAQASVYASDPHIDLVVRGEGERAFLEVLARYAQDAKLPDDVPGTTLAAQENRPSDEIADIDQLPFPARDLLRMDVYLEDQTPLMPYAKRRPVGFLISSRGCPYNCIFCSTSKVWKRWRPRSPKSVVDEIDVLVNEYGAREIAFQDDSFLVDPDRVRRICDEILRRKLDFTWSVPPGIQANRLTADLLEVMKASGFYRACFPIESGDPEILRWIRKPIDFEEAKEAIELCHRFGIWTYGNFIIGFPEQDAASIERTAEYAVSSGLDMISVYVAQPYAGSELYDIFQDLGLIDPEKTAGSTLFRTLYDTKYFTADELEAKRNDINRRFLKRRARRLFTPKGFRDLWRKINTPENLGYALRISGMLARNSLHAGRINLFGSKAKPVEKATRQAARND